jgi:phage terminase large subunit
MNIDFQCTDVFHANYTAAAQGYDCMINQGGTSSSKTYSIMQLLFLKAITEPNVIITVTGESIPNLKKGAYRDAEIIYGKSAALPMHVRFWHKGDRTIYFKNGSIMEFTSNLTEQSAKNGKRQYLFVNEANGISWAIFFQLAIRTIKNSAGHGGQVYIDYNPSAPFWSHDNLIGTVPEGNELSMRVKLIISDHRHNQFLSEKEHYMIENIKDPDRWKVYARGMTGNLDGLIYPNWKQIPDSQFPSLNDAPDFFGGQDFGYTNDPSGGVKAARVGDSIFLHEMCYEPGISPTSLVQLYKANGFTDDNTVFVEHDPDMISQLRRLGQRVTMARKGPGSIKAGIQKVKEYNVFYTASSKNLAAEKAKYMWEIDTASGKPTNTPVGGFDHLMDASRYAIYTRFFRAS